MFVIFNTNNNKVKMYNAENYIIFDDICSLKYLENDDYVLIIIDTEIEEDGILKDYNFMFEEILITLNVKMIITNVKCSKLEEITSFYKIPLIEIS